MAHVIKMSYNPYYVETSIEINGVINKTSWYYRLANGNKRLQDWIDEFFERLVAESSDMSIQVIFTGTELDGDDVIKAAIDCESAPKNKKRGVKISVTVNEKSSREDKLHEMEILYQDAINSPIPDFVSEEIENGFRRALGESFEITIVAPMSSGKSTVINSLLGTDLLPSRNSACTATTARIENDPSKPAGVFLGRRFDKENVLIEDWVEVNEYRKNSADRLLTKWNSDQNTGNIEISGHIPAFVSNKGTNYVFIDTPGPNSHGTNHRQIMLEALQGKTPSMILYVFNVRSPRTKADYSLLADISTIMRKDGRAARDRFIFIANQIDACNPETESISEELELWKTFLEGEFGIMNPVIIPVAAEFAKFLRIEKNYGTNFLNFADQTKYTQCKSLFSHYPQFNMLQYVKGKINSSCFKRLECALKEAKCENDAYEIKTGIPIIEALLRDFLEKHVIASKLKDGVDCLQSVLDGNKIADQEKQLFDRSQEELEFASRKFEEFLAKKEEAEQGFSIKKQIEKFEYFHSQETNEKLASIMAEQNTIQEELDNLPDKMDENEAEKKYASFIEKGKTLCDKIEEILTEALLEDYSSVLQRWEKDYDSFIRKLIDATWGECDIPELRNLQLETLKIPSITELVDKYGNSEQKTRNVPTKRQRTWQERLLGIFKAENPFREFDTGSRKETYNIRIISKQSIIDDVIPKIEDYTVKAIEKFDSHADECIADAKAALLIKIESVDAKLQERAKDLKKATESRAEAEKRAQLAKTRLEWIKGFEPRLKSILNLEDN